MYTNLLNFSRNDQFLSILLKNLRNKIFSFFEHDIKISNDSRILKYLKRMQDTGILYRSSRIYKRRHVASGCGRRNRREHEIQSKSKG